MNRKFLYTAWAVLFILCAAFGFVPERSGVLQALRDVSVESESPIVSTDNRGLTFVTAQGDTYSFWFDKRRFEGVDGRCYVLSEDEKLWELVWGIRTADPDYQDLMR